MSWRPTEVVKKLAEGVDEVTRLLVDEALCYGVGTGLIFSNFKAFPDWFRGKTIMKLNKVMTHLDEITSASAGDWLREFLKFTVIHTHTIGPHNFSLDLEAFCDEHGHCWDCLRKEVFDEESNTEPRHKCPDKS